MNKQPKSRLAVFDHPEYLKARAALEDDYSTAMVEVAHDPNNRQKKEFISLCNGRRKLVKGRHSGFYAPRDKELDVRMTYRERILDREAREALVEGSHPAATVEPTLEPVDLRNVVVSCGRRKDNDTDGNVDHIFIPVKIRMSSGSCSSRKTTSKPPIRREFRPAKRQLLPIDDAIRRSA
ncbi:MAG: hypothetical protein WC693_02665 [Patescibacteria group bacterium]|jgi:hypothetical protein